MHNKINYYLLLFVIGIFTILVNVFLQSELLIKHGNIITLVFWCIIAAIYFIFEKNNYYRNKYKTLVFKDIIVIMVLYYIIYFLLGLVFGFLNSPYNHSILNLVINLANICVLRFMQEYVKYALVKSASKKYEYFIITLSFILIYINYATLFNSLEGNLLTFKYISSILIPLVTTSIISTFLAINSDFKTVVVYTILPLLVTIFSPIFPDFNWFFTGIFSIIYSIFIYVVIKYDLNINKKEESSKQIKRSNPLTLLPYFAVAVILLLFIIGVFKHVPIAVMSNSMYPYFQRGDVVIYEKVNDVNKLKKDDVICYVKDKVIVMHRIVKIERDINNKILVTTKGDNVDNKDAKKVKEKEIIGVIKIIIPKVGFPSIWFYELLKS